MRILKTSSVVFCLVLLIPVAAQARTLQSGSSGRDVRALQKSLAQRHFLRYDQISGYYGPVTRLGVMAFQKWAKVSCDGVAGPVTRQRLARSGQPKPAGRGDSWRLEIWRSSQILVVVERSQVRRIIPVSTGRLGYTTPLGRFRIFSKVRDEWSRRYNSPMPWASYFYGGIALHQSADVPAYPASHGCVRVPASWARDVYHAAPIGRQVLVLNR